MLWATVLWSRNYRAAGKNFDHALTFKLDLTRGATNPQDSQIVDTEGSVKDRPVGGLVTHFVLTIVGGLDYKRVHGRNRTRGNMTAPAL